MLKPATELQKYSALLFQLRGERIVFVGACSQVNIQEFATRSSTSL
jgi:hypothetical protein